MGTVMLVFPPCRSDRAERSPARINIEVTSKGGRRSRKSTVLQVGGVDEIVANACVAQMSFLREEDEK